MSESENDTPKTKERFRLSDEGKPLRRYLLLLSGLSLFIGLTKELPSEFSLLGLKFEGEQKETVSWFIWCINFYFLIQFLIVAAIEFSDFLRPKIQTWASWRKLAEHPVYEDAHIPFPDEPVNPHNMDAVHAEATQIGKATAQKYLKPLDIVARPKIFVDLFLPIILAFVALTFLFSAIRSHDDKTTAEQDGAEQPATAQESKPEGEKKLKPVSEGRSQ